MSRQILPRRLWYRSEGERVVVDAEFLRSDPRSHVVLGEAGMGKSTLLRDLATRSGYVFTTARALINIAETGRFDGAHTLVVDAIDEIPAQREGDAVDLVVRKLAALGLPRFVLSCRVADWRSATALQALHDLYETPPVELYLDPLDREEAIAFLEEGLGADSADAVLTHLERQDLGGLWSNPQTLTLVEDVATQARLPASKGELFQQATRLLAEEHREEKADSGLAKLPITSVLDAAGAIFASLIITGREAVSTAARTPMDDLSLREISDIAAHVGPEVLDSRLFASLGAGRFTYTHRAIGEYLGARWLAAQSDTARKRRRLRELFNGQALVPASLRGIHAWLAWHSSALSEDVIAADPMGVIQYGDADKLNPRQASALLTSLSTLAAENPRFRGWGHYRASGLIQTSLLPEIERLIRGQSSPFGLKLLLLQALKGSEIATQLRDTLAKVLFARTEAFANRFEAGHRLLESALDFDWLRAIRRLLNQKNEDGVRLAYELMEAVGLEKFEDSLLLEIILAQLSRSERTVGIYYGLESRVQHNRIAPLLDGLTSAVRAQQTTFERSEFSAFADLVYALLAKLLRVEHPEPAALWRWLGAVKRGYAFNRETRDEVTEILRSEHELRRATQRQVLLNRKTDASIWTLSWELTERSPGLALTEEDVIELLSELESDDDRWRDIVLTARHEDQIGSAVRDAASRFAAGNSEAQEWLQQLAVPRIPDWQIRDEARKRERAQEREQSWAKHRAEFNQSIESVRSGQYGWIVNPAKAYLNLFADIGEDAPNGSVRLEEWLGPNLRDAVLEGFEKFLTADPPSPTATEIAESFADGRRWEAANIIVAGLAERQRTGRGFSDLSSERLMAGLLELFHSRVDDHAGVADLDAILAQELRNRGAWEATQRLHLEGQFERRRDHVTGLYALLHDPADAALATKLAEEWLHRYPEMAGLPESELIDHLIGSHAGRNALKSLVRERSSQSLPDERRLNWLAIGILLDFAETRRRVEEGGEVEPALLWHIRARLGGRYSDSPAVRLDAQQLTWILETYRSQYEVVGRPNTVTTGETNPWDASEFLSSLINRLGDDVSDDAMSGLVRLRDAPTDGYTEFLRVVSAEQKRKRVEATWHAPDFNDFRATIRDEPPTTSSQLQAVVLEELDRVQRQLRGSDVNWYKDFYTGDAPATEEHCRDALLKMLRPLPFGIEALPEGRLADETRCDILCLLNDLVVPIEIKGQWHPALWSAADRQLDRLYVNDWRAERGIYVVLWFGTSATKKLKSAPRGVGRPTTPDDLRNALVQRSATTRESRVEVIVLDLERPGK